MKHLIEAVKNMGYTGRIGITSTAKYEIVNVYVDGQYIGRWNHATKIIF